MVAIYSLQTATQPVLQKRLDDYEQFGCREDIIRLKRLASFLDGIKITHINSTYFGGGVAENSCS